MKGSIVRIVLIGVAALGAAALPRGAVIVPAGDPAPREIRIVVKDMTFYVDGQDMPNPMLRVNAGEQVRITLRNEDAGMTHDFAVASWKVGTRALMDKGEEDALVFRVPYQRGTTAYHCTPHSEMMRGTIQVE